MARPRPAPRPVSLVVKNGSNALAATSGVMPSPLSVTPMRAKDPAGRFEAVPSSRVAEFDGVHPDRYVAATWHGVTRVDGEVHQEQFEVAGVRQHEVRVICRQALELYVLAQSGAQQVFCVANGCVEVDQHGLSDVMPAEDEELPGQAGRPVSSLLHLGHVLLEITVGCEAVRQELGVTQDRLQQVVEVVGDPAGELPDRLHALRLPEALLGLRLTGKGLVELGVLHFELLDQPECHVPAADRDIEQGGEGQGQQESEQERDPGELIGQETPDARGETDHDHQEGDPMGLHETLGARSDGGAPLMGTSLTGRSLQALHRNPTATQLCLPWVHGRWDSPDRRLQGAW